MLELTGAASPSAARVSSWLGGPGSSTLTFGGGGRWVDGVPARHRRAARGRGRPHGVAGAGREVPPPLVQHRATVARVGVGLRLRARLYSRRRERVGFLEFIAQSAPAAAELCR